MMNINLDDIEFDKKNKNKIGSLLEVKDKCFYYESKLLGEAFFINNNNYKFIYYRSFFSLVRDICDLTLLFLINEEISNSIDRQPYIKLINDIIKNGHYSNTIEINGKRIAFIEKKIDYTLEELNELLVYKFNQTLCSQIFDFTISIFSSFEFWISKIYEYYSDELDSKLHESREKKYKKEIEKYFNAESVEDKDKCLKKIIKLPGFFISFPDKINSIFNKIDKDKYSRDIDKDKELIEYLRMSRNSVHNCGIHKGKDFSFFFKNQKYDLIKDKPQYIEDHNHLILMCSELVDIYSEILISLKDITVEKYTELLKNDFDLNLFWEMIQDVINSEGSVISSDEKLELVLFNFKKFGITESKTKKLIDFLEEIKNPEKNIGLMDVLCHQLI